MTKNSSLKNNKTYQELVLKRDISRFILEMRILTQIEQSEGSLITRNAFRDYIQEYVNSDEKLDELLNRARRLGVNPNYFDTYTGGFSQKLSFLIDETTKEENEEIISLAREISSIQHLCHDAKTLCIELIRFYDSWKNSISTESHYLDYFVNTIGMVLTEYVSCGIKSPEYEYLMHKETCDTFFDDWFKRYFFKDNITPEEHKRNRDLLFNLAIERKDAFASTLWSKILIGMNNPKWQNLPLDESQLTCLIECCHSIASIKLIFKYQVKSKGNLPFTAEEYLDALFQDLITGQSNMEHCNVKGSVFYNPYNKPQKMTAKRIGEILTKLIIPLNQISGLPVEEFFVYLANKVALLDDHLEIATTVSDFISTCEPLEAGQAMTKVFSDAYLEACLGLQEKREQLIFVLNQINKQN